jgi:type III restriction enzyme
LAIAGAETRPGKKLLMPILAPYDVTGSTNYIDFTTARPVYATREDKCHINYVVADTKSWEQKMAQNLEEDPRVLRYVKNHNLDFKIPYSFEGREKNYIPDFIAVIDDGHGPVDPLNLIIEVTGEKKKDKEAKVATTRNLWIPAVNNHGGFGRWGFLEVNDPWSDPYQISPKGKSNG